MKTPLTERFTAQRAFFSCDPHPQHLFSVQPGLAARDALEQASALLQIAHHQALAAAYAADDLGAHGAAILVDMAKSVVDACLDADLENRHE